MNNKHKTFISYHHANDEQYKIAFKKIFADIHDIIVPWDVEIGDIDPNQKTDTIKRKIRDEYLRDSTVTVVLIGTQTWQRKHVDWEISSSIRDTQFNPRSGLLGIFLPSYPLTADNKYNQHTIPPRLYDNVKCGFAKLYKWSNNPSDVQNWIHEAFERRNKINPDNSYPLFVNNRTGNQWQ
ncbi:MAG: TIR domain-containing protein [Bacteroidetes bacterium]|nr:TIR domain-containing protein [Bacteroidota bacterium]